MAYRTRSGVLVPASSMIIARAAVWVLIGLSLPFLLAPVVYALWWTHVISTSATTQVVSVALFVGLVLTALVGAPIASLAFAAGSVRIQGATRVRDQIRYAIRSRTGRVLLVSAVAYLATLLVSLYRFANELRVPLLVLLPLFATAALTATLISLHAPREKKVPLFSDAAATDFNTAARSAGKLHAGGDFPVSVRDIASEHDAAQYAELARARANLCRYVGVLIAAVASAFIGAAFVWAFSGQPGPQVMLAALPISAYLLGYALQHASRYFEGVRERLIARKAQLKSRMRSPLVRQASRSHPSNRRRLRGGR